MSITDHLEALRWTLVRVFTALGVFIIGGFAFVPWIFKHVVMAPIDNGFFLYRWLAKASSMFRMVPDDLTRPFHVDIINIRLSSQFFLHMSLSFWLALLLTFPYLVYEVWKFVCPALYANERRNMRFTFVFGTVMFFIGCMVGYSVVFPLPLQLPAQCRHQQPAVDRLVYGQLPYVGVHDGYNFRVAACVNVPRQSGTTQPQFLQRIPTSRYCGLAGCVSVHNALFRPLHAHGRVHSHLHFVGAECVSCETSPKGHL